MSAGLAAPCGAPPADDPVATTGSLGVVAASVGSSGAFAVAPAALGVTGSSPELVSVFEPVHAPSARLESAANARRRVDWSVIVRTVFWVACIGLVRTSYRSRKSGENWTRKVTRSWAGSSWASLSCIGCATLIASCQSHPKAAQADPTPEPSAPEPGANWARTEGTVTATAPGAAPSPADTGTGLVQVATVTLPHGAPGIGFDDLRYSPLLARVLAPAGRSGRLDLVEPGSWRVVDISGFSERARYVGGHDDGVTSADVGPAVLYATDRTSGRLTVIDARSNALVESAKLAAHPDYVRYVASTQEVWVTEPDAEQIEVFSADGSGGRPVHSASIAIQGGPESLLVDADRSVAYTHLWRGSTVAVDIHSHTIGARWPNGCRSSRGIALDRQHGFVLAACAEGKVTALDVRDGNQVSSIETGAGVDIIDFDPRSRHVYIPSSKTATLLVASLSPEGQLAPVGQVATGSGGHCVTVDEQHNAYVCDPSHGRLLVIHDGTASGL